MSKNNKGRGMNKIDYLKGFADGSNKKFDELFEPVKKETEKFF